MFLLQQRQASGMKTLDARRGWVTPGENIFPILTTGMTFCSDWRLNKFPLDTQCTNEFLGARVLMFMRSFPFRQVIYKLLLRVVTKRLVHSYA